MIFNIIKTWLPGIFLISIMALPSMLWGQNTYVPDDNFEQKLIDWGHDDTLDDYVLTANISGVTNVNLFNLGVISDLTGIEDFTALTSLSCYNTVRAPKPRKARITVINLLGQEIIELVNGRHEVQWQGQGHHGRPVSSGMYFTVLSDGHKPILQKMLLLK